MNDVKLSGRLATTPELKTTAKGVPVCSFVLAVDRISKDDETDFPTIVAWRQTAEFVSRYLLKGRKIIVEGELRTRTYDDHRKTRKVTEVYAKNIEFADRKTTDGTDACMTPEFTEISGDDSLPF